MSSDEHQPRLSKRRLLLAISGSGTLAIAGCQDSSDSGDDAPESGDEPTDTQTAQQEDSSDTGPTPTPEQSGETPEAAVDLDAITFPLPDDAYVGESYLPLDTLPADDLDGLTLTFIGDTVTQLELTDQDEYSPADLPTTAGSYDVQLEVTAGDQTRILEDQVSLSYAPADNTDGQPLVTLLEQTQGKDGHGNLVEDLVKNRGGETEQAGLYNEVGRELASALDAYDSLSPEDNDGMDITAMLLEKANEDTEENKRVGLTAKDGKLLAAVPGLDTERQDKFLGYNEDERRQNLEVDLYEAIKEHGLTSSDIHQELTEAELTAYRFNGILQDSHFKEDEDPEEVRQNILQTIVDSSHNLLNGSEYGGNEIDYMLAMSEIASERLIYNNPRISQLKEKTDKNENPIWGGATQKNHVTDTDLQQMRNTTDQQYNGHALFSDAMKIQVFEMEDTDKTLIPIAYALADGSKNTLREGAELTEQLFQQQNIESKSYYIGTTKSMNNSGELTERLKKLSNDTEGYFNTVVFIDSGVRAEGTGVGLHANYDGLEGGYVLESIDFTPEAIAHEIGHSLGANKRPWVDEDNPPRDKINSIMSYVNWSGSKFLDEDIENMNESNYERGTIYRDETGFLSKKTNGDYFSGWEELMKMGENYEEAPFELFTEDSN